MTFAQTSNTVRVIWRQTRSGVKVAEALREQGVSIRGALFQMESMFFVCVFPHRPLDLFVGPPRLGNRKKVDPVVAREEFEVVSWKNSS